MTEKIRFEDLQDSPSALWGLLLAMGYLTPKRIHSDDLIDYNVELVIPNEEIKAAYKNIFTSWLEKVSGGQNADLLNTLRRVDIESFCEKVQNYLRNYASIQHLKYEGCYHSLILGLIYGLGDTHYVFSGILETGFGFSDLWIIPKETVKDNHTAILIEFKRTESDENGDTSAQKAFDQITRKEYDRHLKQYPGITTLIKIGMAFVGKTVYKKIEMESWAV